MSKLVYIQLFSSGSAVYADMAISVSGYNWLSDLKALIDNGLKVKGKQIVAGPGGTYSTDDEWYNSTAAYLRNS